MMDVCVMVYKTYDTNGITTLYLQETMLERTSTSEQKAITHL